MSAAALTLQSKKPESKQRNTASLAAKRTSVTPSIYPGHIAKEPLTHLVFPGNWLGPKPGRKGSVGTEAFPGIARPPPVVGLAGMKGRQAQSTPRLTSVLNFDAKAAFSKTGRRGPRISPPPMRPSTGSVSLSRSGPNGRRTPSVPRGGRKPKPIYFAAKFYVIK